MQVRRWQLWTFRGIAAVTALLVMFAVPNVLSPWIHLINLDPNVSSADVDVERWHNAVQGSGDAMAFLALLALVRRPSRHPLAAVFLLAGLVISLLVVVPFVGPSMVWILGPLAGVVVTYPYWRQVRPTSLKPYVPALAVAAVAAAALLIPAAAALMDQISRPTDPAAIANTWVAYAEHLTWFAVAGLLACCRLPGWRLFAWLTAVRWAYLGAVLLTVPGQLDSWGPVGGAAALMLSAGFVVVARRESRPRQVEQLASVA
jgi:hypothetical protein